MVFHYVDNKMNVYCSIGANENKGFNTVTDIKLTQWSENGHYYLYMPGACSWTRAVERTGDFKLAGMQGYLATFSNMDERLYMQKVFDGTVWVGATNLTWDDGTRLNNPSRSDLQVKKLKNDVSNPYYWGHRPRGRASCFAKPLESRRAE